MKIQWFSIIRVIGLLFVLVYHFSKGILPGGFIGVDVFFTFSGFLITALLVDEFFQKGSINFAAYLRRRFYRIFPPLLFMILQVMPFVLLIRRDFLASIGYQITAAIGFVTNIYEILLGNHYENQFTPHLFLHTWSLAIEFQYYLVWGLGLWLLAILTRTAATFRQRVLYFSSCLSVISVLAMVLGSLFGVSDSVLYFSSLSHSFPLFIGSFFGALSGVQQTGGLHLWLKKRLEVRKTLLLAGLLGILLLCLAKGLHFESEVTYRVGFVLASLVAAMLIVLCRVLHDQLPNLREPRLFSYLANISYSMYLYHWPILQITKNLVSLQLAIVLTTMLSLVFSTVSFYFLEPMVMGHLKVERRQRIVVQLSMVVTVVYVAILAIHTIHIAKQAPVLGPFEQSMLEKNLQQYDTGMATTKELAVGANRSKQVSTKQEAVKSDYSNVLLIGDSVALDAAYTRPETLKSATVDVADSRRFDQAYEIYKTYVDAGHLPTYTVIAIGINSPDNYQTTIQAFLSLLPKNHHLIFVTPYSQTEATDQLEAIRDYELKLAKKDARVSVADWYQVASQHTELWSGSDGTHFSHTVETSRSGAALYLGAIVDVLDTFKESKSPSLVTDNTLFIGDSVAVHAGESVVSTFSGAIIDSKSNRNLIDAADIIANYKANGPLPKTVILAVGVNEVTNSKEVLETIIKALPDGSRLVLVTPYNGSYSDIKGSNVYKTRQNELKLAKQYNFIAVADWKKTAEAHPEIWEGTDFVHFERTDGLLDYDLLAKASGYYTETIERAFKQVAEQPAKGEG